MTTQNSTPELVDVSASNARYILDLLLTDGAIALRDVSSGFYDETYPELTLMQKVLAALADALGNCAHSGGWRMPVELSEGTVHITARGLLEGYEADYVATDRLEVTFEPGWYGAPGVWTARSARYGMSRGIECPPELLAALLAESKAI